MERRDFGRSGPATSGTQDIKGSTLLWGAFLLLIGGLLIAAGLGLRFDFTTTAIACLAGLGGLLVVAALIPKGRRSIKP